MTQRIGAALDQLDQQTGAKLLLLRRKTKQARCQVLDEPECLTGPCEFSQDCPVRLALVPKADV